MNCEFYDNLPPKLLKEEQNKLLEKAIKGSKLAKEKLIEHNMRLVLYVVGSYFYSNKDIFDDLVQAGALGLEKAIDTFDTAKKSNFSTYAYRCIYNEINSYLRIMTRKRRYIISDESKFNKKYDQTIDIESIYEKEELKVIIKNIIDELPLREQIVIKLYFGFLGDKKSTYAIAKIINVSEQYTCKLLKRALSIIKNKLIEKEIYDDSKMVG